MNLAYAIAITAEFFKDVTDKGGRPYILHCLAVMYSLNSLDDELNCIAVMHDLIEDSNGVYTYQKLKDLGFSQRVIVGIDGVTKRQGESYDDFIERSSGNFDSLRVKKADLQHNSLIQRLKGISDKDKARMMKYHESYLYLCQKEQNYIFKVS